MYWHKQICVKNLEVILTSIIKQKSELFRYIRTEYKYTYISVNRSLQKLTLTLKLKNSSVSNKLFKVKK